LISCVREDRREVGERGARVPRRRLPSPALRALARVVPPLRTLTPLLDRDLQFSSAKAQRVAPRPAADTILDCAASLTGLTPVAVAPQ
jgi:hypothetical protein